MTYPTTLTAAQVLAAQSQAQSIANRAANVIGNHTSRSTTARLMARIRHHVAGKFARRRFEISDQTVNP